MPIPMLVCWTLWSPKYATIDVSLSILNKFALNSTLQKKRVSEANGMRYSSAPSLVSPLPAESSAGAAILPSLQQPHQLAPLTTSSGGSNTSSIGSTSGTSAHLPKKELVKHSSLESKPKRLVMLQDSPLSQHKLKNVKILDNHSTPLHPIEHAPQAPAHERSKKIHIT